MSNPCPIANCQGHAAPGNLMCLRHWRMLPSNLKDRVWRSWRELRFAQGPSQRELLSKYREARQAAIDSIQGIERGELPLLEPGSDAGS